MYLSQFANVFKIVGGVIALLNFAGIIFIFLANKVSFNKIITNDLSHISDDIKGIQTEQVYIKDKVTELSESIAFIKGQADIIFKPKKRVRRVTKRKAKV